MDSSHAQVGRPKAHGQQLLERKRRDVLGVDGKLASGALARRRDPVGGRDELREPISLVRCADNVDRAAQRHELAQDLATDTARRGGRLRHVRDDDGRGKLFVSLGLVVVS